MIHQTITFECITPCFCAGADQTKAEIRPTALRGALRWWFRALGGTPELEQEAFGGANPVRVSALQIRVSQVSKKRLSSLPKPNTMSPLAYILYYASISGDDSGTGRQKRAQFGQGPRWTTEGALGPGTTFQLRLRQTRSVSEDCERLILRAIEALKHFGAIGTRVTRGLGAIQWTEANRKSFDEVIEDLSRAGFIVREGTKSHTNWESLMKEAGQWLKFDLRKEFTAGGGSQQLGVKPPQASALGSIQPVRQTSAVHLRPIKLDGNLIFSAYEAPHEKVLGDSSKQKHLTQILAERDFSLNPPSQ